MSKERLRVTTRDGKYTVIENVDGSISLMRYNEPWLQLPWSKVLLAFAQELEETRRPALCSVCAGTGKPVSGIRCICDGKGTQLAELQGFRERCYDLEEQLRTRKEIE